MVHRIACPLFASLRMSAQIAHDVFESNPEVGSSRKSNSAGFAATVEMLITKQELATKAAKVHPPSSTPPQEGQHDKEWANETPTYRKTFALFDVEALTRDADDRLGVILHLEQPYDLLDIGNLLMMRSRRGLTQDRAEPQRLAHR